MRMIRRNKHGAKGIRADGIFFPSQGEHRRYQELKLMEKGGAIKEIIVHPRYPIVYQGIHICNVVLDFEYYALGRKRKLSEYATWNLTYEDFKGYQTSESKLRHKLFEAFYNQKILITRATETKRQKEMR